MRPRTAQVGEDPRIGATALFERVGQHSQASVIQLTIRQGAFVIRGLGQGNDRIAEQRLIVPDWLERIAEDLADQLPFWPFLLHREVPEKMLVPLSLAVG